MHSFSPPPRRYPSRLKVRSHGPCSRLIVNFDARTQAQMIDQVKTFTADSGQALRVRLEEWAKELKSWLARPWDMRRFGRAVALTGATVALGWCCWRLLRWSRRRWRGWRRPQEFDPVRQEAGRLLGRLRGPASDKGPVTSARLAGSEVIADLQRLRYGRRETWPEPRGVFKRAKQASRAARR